ncbi:MAG: hypothetical protein OHK0029_34010 [Armatimonadaceae bacterium]
MGDAAVEFPSSTIMVAEMVDNLQCLNGQSLGTGIRNSSHRSTNAATLDAANTQQYLGEQNDVRASPLFALNANQVRPLFDACRTNPNGGYPLITYISPVRHSGGSNYTFADGSAKWFRFEQTVQPNNYRWGAVMYSSASRQRLIDPISGLPVQQN